MICCNVRLRILICIVSVLSCEMFTYACLDDSDIISWCQLISACDMHGRVAHLPPRALDGTTMVSLPHITKSVHTNDKLL